MYQQKGFAHLLPLLLAVVGIGIIVVLVAGGVIKLPNSKTTANVEVKTDYKNPFAKESQYVNPFDQYKSPFLSLKEK